MGIGYYFTANDGDDMNDLFFVFVWNDKWWELRDVVTDDQPDRLMSHLQERISVSHVAPFSNRLVVQWSVGTGCTVYWFNLPEAFPMWIDATVSAEVAQRALDSLRSQCVAEVFRLYGGNQCQLK